jgi:hypothetical protein
MNSLRTPLLTGATVLLAAALSTGLLSTTASAQQKDKPKKLYCWDEGSRRVCSDTLPASAVGHQRTELNAVTGSAINRVARALTAEERVVAAQEARAQESEEDRRRREMAMVVSYSTEKDLQRAFQERFALVDEGLKSSSMAHTNLHKSLISLLRQANELELAGKPVGKALRNRILAQHRDLGLLLATQQRLHTERGTLQGEYERALVRYRELKGSAAASVAATTPAAGG